MTTIFERGEVVWGKIKGYPWWPAVIIDFSDHLIYTIKFYSDNSYAKLSSKFLLKYEDNKIRIIETNKKNKKLLNAVQAADSYINAHNNEDGANNEKQKILGFNLTNSDIKIDTEIIQIQN